MPHRAVPGDRRVVIAGPRPDALVAVAAVGPEDRREGRKLEPPEEELGGLGVPEFVDRSRREAALYQSHAGIRVR